MKLSSDHVALPREDYHELTTSAFTNPTAKDRVASTIQGTAMMLSIAAAVTAGTWGWAKANDWLEERRARRGRDEFEMKTSARNQK